nr:putative ribonuclease H-like domain-containing protein [Tanacetum cinerariifolium]
EAPQVPQSPMVSPVREPIPERQPTPERPLSPPPSSPETEWVVPDPVLPVADWRPWPYVHVYFSEPESPPFPPKQTFLYEEPVEFGPVPRPTGYVDPDDIEPIFFGPQPRPMDYVEPDFEVPIFFGPQPRPKNYVEPEEPDVIISMEDDTIHGGFHVESPVRSNDAPKPTADTAGRVEDPSMLTILSDKLDRCMGRIATLEKDLDTSKQRHKLVIADSDEEAEVAAAKEDDIDLDEITALATAALGPEQPVVPTENANLQRHKLVIADSDEEAEVAAAKEDDIDLDEITALATAALGPEQPAVPIENVEPMEEQEEMEASERLLQQLRAEDLAQEHLPNISEQRQKELDELMMRMTEADWLNLMIQVGSDPTLARELLGADVNEENFIPRMNAMKERKKRALTDLRYRALQNKPMKKSEVTEFMRAFVKGQWCAAHNGHIEIRHHFIRDANEKNLIQVLKIHTDDNVADLLTKAFDGPKFKFLVVHIGMLYILPADIMVSAGLSMFLLVVLIPAGSFVPAGRHTFAGEFISIGGCVFMLLSRFLLIVDSFCWLDTFMLLANLYLLSQHSFCCAQYDTAGWSVSTGSHSISTGSLQSCWYNHVSADE